METHIWDVRAFKDNLHQYPYINDIKDTVIKGGLVAIPTETVYGLGANAKDEVAVKRFMKLRVDLLTIL